MFTRSPIADVFHRLIAGGVIALVLTLTILAASPEAHEGVHHGCHHDEVHSCAVVLFAQGFCATLETVTAPVPDDVWADFTPPLRRELRLVAPRYLRHPERGPPIR